jgi:hypothetical protein
MAGLVSPPCFSLQRRPFHRCTEPPTLFYDACSWSCSSTDTHTHLFLLTYLSAYLHNWVLNPVLQPTFHNSRKWPTINTFYTRNMGVKIGRFLCLSVSLDNLSLKKLVVKSSFSWTLHLWIHWRAKFIFNSKINSRSLWACTWPIAAKYSRHARFTSSAEKEQVNFLSSCFHSCPVNIQFSYPVQCFSHFYAFVCHFLV